MKVWDFIKWVGLTNGEFRMNIKNFGRLLDGLGLKRKFVFRPGI